MSSFEGTQHAPGGRYPARACGDDGVQGEDGVARLRIAQNLAQHLKTAPVPQALLGKRDEREFQRWLARAIRDWAESTPTGIFMVKAEADGGGVQPVEILGTGFWPDVAIGTAERPVALAVEVKCLTRRNRASHTSQPIGQALMYRELYEECLVVLVLVESIEKPVELPWGLARKLSGNNIELVVIDASDKPRVMSGV